MNISLLDCSRSPLETCVAAAKGCYSPYSIRDIISSLTKDDDREAMSKYIGGIIKSGHLSTIEHANYTFAIDGVSRACTHQIVRHRVASFSQQSQRYVHFKGELEEMFVIPPEIEEAGLKTEFLSDCNDAVNSYNFMVYKLLEAGRTQEQANEDARFLLPNAAKTNITVTMNARELGHFFGLRCCRRAQWEINEVAWQMYELCMIVTPEIFKHFGPNCVTSVCKEGTRSCGNPYPTRY